MEVKNISLDIRSSAQAQALRAKKFPQASPRSVTDSFIFQNEILELNFETSEAALREYLRDQDSSVEKRQKYLRLREEAYNRLGGISEALGVSRAATLRAILAVAVQKLEEENADSGVKTLDRQRLAERIRRIEERVDALKAELSMLRADLLQEEEREE